MNADFACDLNHQLKTESQHYVALKRATLYELGLMEATASALRTPLSLIELYLLHATDLSSSLTLWSICVFELEEHGLIETWTDRSQLYMRLTPEGRKCVLGNAHLEKRIRQSNVDKRPAD